MSQRKSLRIEIEDRISSLPGNVIDQILSHVPIRDAVRTSILSSSWRNKWATLPSLVFDNKITFPDSPFLNHDIFRDFKLKEVIDHVLLLHYGPIHKFELSYGRPLPAQNIDKWIFHLSRRSIQELILKIVSQDKYKMPSCLFSFENLKHLDLTRCFLKLPSTFKGFIHLKRLDLTDVFLAQDGLENLISKCCMLERLTLNGLDGVHHLNIHAPNLVFVKLRGEFVYVSFKKAGKLAVVSVDADWNVNYQKGACGNSGNLLKFLAPVSQIVKLDVQGYFLAYLAVGVIPSELPKPCVNLHHLSICIDFNNLEETSVAICLLRSFPNLQTLETHSWQRTQEKIGTDFWEAEHWNRPFTNLRHVNVTGFLGTNAEMNFIKFMLLTSPTLEVMTIKLCDMFSVRRQLELAKKLLHFKRASKVANIDFVEP